MKKLLTPGYFSINVAADKCRMEYDFKNEQLLHIGIRPDFVFIGDSITQLWDIDAYFRDRSCFIVNRGIGGDTSEYLLKRFEADVLQLEPDNIVLLIGINDMFAIDGDAWWRKEGEATDTVRDKIVKNIESIVLLCKLEKRNIIVCSILPTDIAPPFKKEERNELIIEVNDSIKDICKYNDLLYVDYHSSMTQSDGKTLIYDYSPDGIHPNSKGYSVMSEILKYSLESRGITL